ncbi:hypothetical protein [Dongshaea marina]|uniref:hypothetical protein n=1 Tax=Dongshaea marina TaxID=2047966 RepID=UPI000D3E8BC8|nr:hypothetical protein [Dongshaea marina]
MNHLEFLRAIETHDLTLVSDAADLLSQASAQGFKTSDFNQFSFDSNCLFLITKLINQQALLNKEDLGIFSANILLNKFLSTPDEASYSLSSLLNTRLIPSVTKRDKIYQEILQSSGCLVQSGEGHRAEIRLKDEIEAANFDQELTQGWLYTMAEFLEAAIFNQEHKESSFSVKGRFQFDGIIHLYTHPDATRHHATMQAWQQEVAESGGYLEIEHSAITRLVIADRDRTSELMGLCQGKERGTEILEFAFGCGQRHSRELNWQLNSPLNEGVNGVHFGIGMGRQIPHIDFVSTNASYQFSQ